MISFLHSHFPVAGLLKFVFVYLANTAVLCYSLTIICCCQVQNYIYWLISTENDHRHHHKFIKYEKRLRKEGNMLDLPINNNQAKSLPLLWVRSIQRQRSNWSPTCHRHLKSGPPFFLIWSLPRLWYGSLSGSISLNHLSICYNISCYNIVYLHVFVCLVC